MGSLPEIFQFLAGLSCSLVAGSALYVSLVEHPARMDCATEVAVAEFSSSYRRASRMQPPLAALGLLSSIGVWLLGGNVWWLIGGMTLVSVVPFTLIVIVPINDELSDPSLDKRSDRTAELLSRWGHLHAARSVLSLAALVIFLSLLIIA